MSDEERELRQYLGVHNYAAYIQSLIFHMGMIRIERECSFCKRPMPTNHPACFTLMQMDTGDRL